MNLNQTRAANLEGVHRWRIVYHYRTGNNTNLNHTETIAWFHTTPDAAWSDAAALLPPVGYTQPHAVTVERGTFTPAPEGGHQWQHIGPTQIARVDHTGLVRVHQNDEHDQDLGVETPTEQAAALTAGGQQQLF